MKINIQRIERLADEKIRELLQENTAMIDRCVYQIRDIALNLRPPHLDELGLSYALNWYLKKQARIAGFQESLIIVPPEIQVPRELATVCFRIAQEAVTNAMTHASPNRIEIELIQSDSELRLKIRDDGEGFDVKKALTSVSQGNSFGLNSMLERVALANGKIEIESAPEQGSTIHAWFSLSP